MKRIVTLLLALIMCVSVFASFGMTASAETGSDIIVEETFDNVTTVPATSTGVGLFFGNYYNTGAAYGGQVAISNKMLEVSQTKTGRGFIDLRPYSTSVNRITEDFRLTIRFKLTGTWASNYFFFDFGGGALISSSTAEKTPNARFYKVENGKLRMTTDAGNQYSDVNIVDNYVTVDWIFKKTNGVFNYFECYVNGELLGVKTDAYMTHTYIDRFRIFDTHDRATDTGVSIDYITFAKGSMLYRDGEALYSENFDNMTSVTGYADKLYMPFIAASGTATASINDGKYVITAVDARKSFDFQPWMNTKNARWFKGDFSLSMNLMLLGEWSGTMTNVMCFRDYDESVSGKGTWYNFFSVKDNHLVMNTDAGNKTSELDLTVNYAQITWVFKMNASGLYNQVLCYVNGELLGTKTFTSTELDCIDHFRMFDDTSDVKGDGISIDSIKFVGQADACYVAPTEKTEFIGFQTTAANNGQFDLRLLAIMRDKDVENYTKVGFKVEATYEGGSESIENDIKSVYEKIIAVDGSGYREYTAANLGGSYIFALNCIGVPATAEKIDFVVTTYYQIGEGDVVEEETVTFSVYPATDVPQTEVN